MTANNCKNKNLYEGVTAPVLRFGFENEANGKLTSDDGSVKATLLNSTAVPGYCGKGIHIKYGFLNGGLLVEEGAFAKKIEGKSGFTASVWIKLSLEFQIMYCK